VTGADSAGQPWAGRSFTPNEHAADDGRADPALLEALRRFVAHEVGETEVVDALRGARLLIPLIAVLGESGVGEHGHLVDKSQELSIVTVAGPDGRTVLPAFTSVETMGRWNPSARPVPAEAVRVALAAASEQTELVVLDPGSDTEFVVRRPAVWAIARGEAWAPSHSDETVLAEFMKAVEAEPAVVTVRLLPGDPTARLAGPELLVRLAVAHGLERDEVRALTARLQERVRASAVIAERVDSMRLQVVTA